MTPPLPQWISRDDWIQLPLPERALAVAAALDGVVEERRNSGLWVDRFLASVGLGPGFAWCAAFVYWVLRASGYNVKDLPQSGRGAVYSWMVWADQKGLIRSAPERGGLFFWCERKLIKGRWVWQGHIGFVTRVLGRRFSTIEGNTNEAGSREGTMVGRQERSAGEGVRFISLASILGHNGGEE